jgi:hypothetical protein
VLKQYQDDFENISFTEGIILPTGDAEAGFWSGSYYPKESASSDPGAIRAYET